ncbi:MAG: O-antigen ligase family protein [Halalkalicoccus sp.]
MYPLFAPLVALALVVMALATSRLDAVHIVLAYLFVTALVLVVHDHRANDGISPLLSLQTALVFALGGALLTLVVGGLGVRTLELAVVLSLLLAFGLAHRSPRTYLPTALPYLDAFAVLVGVFLYHAREFGAGSGLGLFPVLAGLLLAINLFVLPRYVPPVEIYRAVALVSGVVSALGITALVTGDFSIWILEIRRWDATTIGLGLPAVRSIFANPNTFGLLAFPGTLASAVLLGRARERSAPPERLALPAIALSLSGAGLYLSNSRASMLAAAVALGIYAAVALEGRRAIRGALVAVAVGVPAFLLALYLSVLPIDPANRFTLWHAGFEAVRHDSGLLGQGLVGTREALEPYSTRGESVHSSYLSMFIRAGFLGGVAYAVLVLGPLVGAARRPERVSVGMLALSTGFAVHQLFEGYTLFQFGHGSILGALAVGYVVAGLAGDDVADGTTSETDASESDPRPGPSGHRAFGAWMARNERQ